MKRSGIEKAWTGQWLVQLRPPARGDAARGRLRQRKRRGRTATPPGRPGRENPTPAGRPTGRTREANPGFDVPVISETGRSGPTRARPPARNQQDSVQARQAAEVTNGHGTEGAAMMRRLEKADQPAQAGGPQPGYSARHARKPAPPGRIRSSSWPAATRRQRKLGTIAYDCRPVTKKPLNSTGKHSGGRRPHGRDPSVVDAGPDQEPHDGPHRATDFRRGFSAVTTSAYPNLRSGVRSGSRNRPDTLTDGRAAKGRHDVVDEHVTEALLRTAAGSSSCR